MSSESGSYHLFICVMVVCVCVIMQNVNNVFFSYFPLAVATSCTAPLHTPLVLCTDKFYIINYRYCQLTDIF